MNSLSSAIAASTTITTTLSFWFTSLLLLSYFKLITIYWSIDWLSIYKLAQSWLAVCHYSRSMCMWLMMQGRMPSLWVCHHATITCSSVLLQRDSRGSSLPSRSDLTAVLCLSLLSTLTTGSGFRCKVTLTISSSSRQSVNRQWVNFHQCYDTLGCRQVGKNLQFSFTQWYFTWEKSVSVSIQFWTD